jgi:hypothetical protein
VHHGIRAALTEADIATAQGYAERSAEPVARYDEGKMGGEGPAPAASENIFHRLPDWPCGPSCGPFDKCGVRKY